MRVIAGRFKSRKLIFPKSKSTRPVTDRAKETIFNVLGDLTGALVLDLFSGSGSLGIEALSRGAKMVDFVDQSREAKTCIQTNLLQLGILDQAHIHQCTVQKALKLMQKQAKKHDRIFLDPPYNKGLTKKSLHEIEASDTLAPQGIIIVGHSHIETLPLDLKNLDIKRQIKLGQSYISFLAYK